MNDGLITVRYVKALYQLAESDGKQKAVKEDIDTLLKCIKELPEFSDFLNNPLLKVSKKAKLIDELFKGRVQNLSLNFLHLLVKNRREMHLHNMCIYFNSYYRKKIGVKNASITTAKSLSKSHKQEIFNFISKKFKVNIDLKEEVNPAIIGGFVLRIEDQQINASLEAQLNKIKRELINL